MIDFDEMIKKPSKNEALLREDRQVLPLTETEARDMSASLGYDYDRVWDYDLKDLFRQLIIPSVQFLGFMGVDVTPDVILIGDDFPEHPEIVQIRHTNKLNLQSKKSIQEHLKIATQNARDGEVACTLGHMRIPIFAMLFAYTAHAVKTSTTAHRRYKDRFVGQKIRLIMHTDYDHAEMFMPDGLSNAIDTSTQCFFAGA